MTLARFTPSLLDGQTLERLFVHREGLLADVLARIEAAARSDERRHRLFVGPRGAGKTHLISLVHHRAVQAQAAGLSVRLSWLLEDPWEIESYDDLLEQVLEQVEPAMPRGDGSPENALLRAADGSPIVVLVENLDQILTAIGRDGQQRLRALLENNRPLLLIATSTRLSDDLLSQAEPFYSFFDTTQFEPFTVDQAADMLAAVAEVTNNPALGALLQTPAGRARLATIDHLAGGQPRVWALLGTGLSLAGIDEMVEMLLSRFDDLTPYYQEQLARLSPNEAKVVRRLADADRPLTVTALAEVSRIDPKSVAKTVSDLRRKGWVRQHRSILTERADARLRYYELAEPLARIAFQVKAARGTPIKLVLDFLATWYEAEELLDADTGGASDVYRSAALAAINLHIPNVARMLSGERWRFGLHDSHPEVVQVLAALDDGLRAWEQGDPGPLLGQPATLCSLIAQRLRDTPPARLRAELARAALLYGGGDGWRRRLDELAELHDPWIHAVAVTMVAIVDLAGDATDDVVSATLAAVSASVQVLEEATADRWASLVNVLMELLRAEHRLQLLQAMDRVPENSFCWRMLQQLKINALGEADRHEDALVLADQVRRTAQTSDGEDSDAYLDASFFLGHAQQLAGRSEEAMQTLRDLVARGERVRGAEAVPTLITRWLLALVLSTLDNCKGQTDLTRLLDDCVRDLGNHHYVTRHLRSTLTRTA